MIDSVGLSVAQGDSSQTFSCLALYSLKLALHIMHGSVEAFCILLYITLFMFVVYTVCRDTNLWGSFSDAVPLSLSFVRDESDESGCLTLVNC